MNPDKLAELNPVKMIAGLVVMLGMMALGLLMFNAMGPSSEELAESDAQRAQMDFVLQQQQMLEEMKWNSQISGEDYAEAMSYGQNYQGQ